MAVTKIKRVRTKKHVRTKKRGGETIVVIKKKQSSNFSMDKESLRHRLQIANPFMSVEKMTSLVHMFEEWIDLQKTPRDFYSWLFDVVGAVWTRQNETDPVVEYISDKPIYGRKFNKRGAVKIRGYYFDHRSYLNDGIGYRTSTTSEAGKLDWRGLLRAITLRDALGLKSQFRIRGGQQLIRKKNIDHFIVGQKFIKGYEEIAPGKIIVTESSKRYNSIYYKTLNSKCLEDWSTEILHATGKEQPTPLERANVIEKALDNVQSARQNYCIHYNFRALFDSGANRKKIFTLATFKTDENHQHMCQRCSLPILCEHNYILREDGVENNPIKSRRFDQFARRIINDYYCKWCGYKLISAIDETVVDFNDSKDFSDAEIALDQTFISNCSQILYLMGFKTFFTPQSIFRDLEPHLISLSKKDMSDRAKQIYQNMLIIAYLIKSYLESKTDKPFIREIAQRSGKMEISNKLAHAIESVVKLSEHHESFKYLVPGIARQHKILEKIVGRLFTEARTRDLTELKIKKNFVGNGYLIFIDPLTTTFIGSLFEHEYPDLAISDRIKIFGDGETIRDYYPLTSSASTVDDVRRKLSMGTPPPKKLLFANGNTDLSKYKMREMENFCTDGSLHQFVGDICLNCGIHRDETTADEKSLLKLYDRKFGRNISTAKIESPKTPPLDLPIKLNEPHEYYKISGVDVKAAKAFFDGAGKIKNIASIRSIIDPNKLDDAENFAEVDPDIVRRAIISFFTGFNAQFKNQLPKILITTYQKIISAPQPEKLSLYKKFLATMLIQTSKVPGSIAFHKKFFADTTLLQSVNNYDIQQYERERDELFMRKVINFVTNASKTMDQKVKELFGDNALVELPDPEDVESFEPTESEESIRDRIDETNQLEDDDVNDDRD